MTQRTYKISLYLIVGLCILLYANTLSNGYSFDDDYVIVNNKKVAQGFSGIPGIFKSRYIELSDQSFGYRPVTLTSFAIEYQLFGATPFVSHLINLLLYIVTCLLIFKILRTLFKNSHWFFPLVATLLFVVHPIHTEVVNNVKSRDELLCFLFALLALASAIRFVRRNQKRYLLGMFIFMGLSLLSKLSSLTFLAIIPLALYFFEKVEKKTLLKVVGVLLLPVVFYKLINTQLISATANRSLLFIENPLFVKDTGFFDRIPMAFYTFFYYVKLLFVPHPLISYYGYNYVPIAGWGDPLVWAGILIAVPVALFTLWKFKTRSILVFGLAFFLISISMYLNLVKPAVGIIAERFVYIPSLGFCIVIGWLLLKLSKVNLKTGSEGTFPHLTPVFYGISGLLLIAATLTILTRNNDWKDLQTLLKTDLEVAPNSVKLNMLLANNIFKTVTTKTLDDQKKDSLLDQSVFYYLQALETYPHHIPAHNNLGVLYNLKGNLEKSHEHLLKASEGPSPDAQAFFNLALSYHARGDFSNAIENLEKAQNLNKNDFQINYNLMNIYFENGNLSKALDSNLKMFRLFPKERKQIFSIGQNMAEATHGPGTTYYIDLLLQKKLISPNTYQGLKNQLKTASPTLSKQ